MKEARPTKSRVRLVCRVCGPQKRTMNGRAYQTMEEALNRHMKSWEHTRRAQVYFEEVNQ